MLLAGLGDLLAVLVLESDLLAIFSFNGELAFSMTDDERRAFVVADDGDFAVDDAVVPLTFDFIVKVDGFGGALKGY